MDDMKCYHCGGENLKQDPGYETILRCKDCGCQNQVRKTWT